MKDPRGVERGACSSCSCQAYEHDATSPRAACSYCECPAPAHLEVLDSMPIEKPSTSSSIPIVIEVQGGPISSSPSTPAGTASSSEPSSDEIAKLFPKRFPLKVRNGLAKKCLSFQLKTTLTQCVVSKLYDAGMDSNVCLKKATKRALEQYSPLRDPLDPTGQKLFEKMRRRRDHLNDLENSKDDLDGIAPLPPDTELTPSEAAEKLRDDWVRGVRVASKFSHNMEIAQEKLKNDARTRPGLQLLRDYRCLHLPELLMECFVRDVKVSEVDMRRNWMKFISNLELLMEKEGIQLSVSASLAMRTVCILKNVHLMKQWVNTSMKAKENNRAKYILEEFEASETLGNMSPKDNDPPRLLMRSPEGEDTLSIQCYIETEPLFTTNDPINALNLLLGSYQVLGIKWPNITRLPLLLLFSMTVGTEPIRQLLSGNGKITDYLKAIGIL